jgi:hypothetical protein
VAVHELEGWQERWSGHGDVSPDAVQAPQRLEIDVAHTDAQETLDFGELVQTRVKSAAGIVGKVQVPADASEPAETRYVHERRAARTPSKARPTARDERTLMCKSSIFKFPHQRIHARQSAIKDPGGRRSRCDFL